MSNHYQRHTLNKLFNLFLYIRNQPRNIKKPIYMKDKYLLRISFLYYLRNFKRIFLKEFIKRKRLKDLFKIFYNRPLKDIIKKIHLKEFIKSLKFIF